MARKYQITAEVKKGDQEWASVVLNRDSPMTEESLAKSFATVKKGFGNSKVDIEIRNFECARV